METNNFMVTYDKEDKDIEILIGLLKEADWLKRDTFFINCFPEYSSRLTHLLSHKLSYLNNHEPFEVLDLKMPYPNMVQVWDNEDKMFKMYIKYLSDWVRKNINKVERFLFIGTDTSGSNFTRLKSMVNGRVDEENYRFATLYKSKEGIFLPDYYVQEYEGKVLFQWENSNNPNK